MTEILVVLLLGPFLTVVASRSLLPVLSFAGRLALALPQIALFSIGAILRAYFGFFSRWEYLMWFSVLAGPALGFWLASVVSKTQTRPSVENA